MNRNISCKTFFSFCAKSQRCKSLQSFHSFNLKFSLPVLFRYFSFCAVAGGTKRKKKGFCEDTSRSGRGSAPAPREILTKMGPGHLALRQGLCPCTPRGTNRVVLRALLITWRRLLCVCCSWERIAGGSGRPGSWRVPLDICV